MTDRHKGKRIGFWVEPEWADYLAARAAHVGMSQKAFLLHLLDADANRQTERMAYMLLGIVRDRGSADMNDLAGVFGLDYAAFSPVARIIENSGLVKIEGTNAIWLDGPN
jgi:hypothetical protein